MLSKLRVLEQSSYIFPIGWNIPEPIMDSSENKMVAGSVFTANRVKCDKRMKSLDDTLD